MTLQELTSLAKKITEREVKVFQSPSETFHVTVDNQPSTPNKNADYTQAFLEGMICYEKTRGKTTQIEEVLDNKSKVGGEIL